MPTPIITKTNIVTEFVTNITELTNTNFITETINQTAIKSMPLDVWTILGTMATLASAGFMAWSIHEMREQYKQQKKDNQDREDKKELKDFIEKSLISEVEKLKKHHLDISYNITIQDFESFNSHTYSSLVNLNFYSIGMFYEDEIKEIYNQIQIYSPIIAYPEGYSYEVKKLWSILLQVVSTTLYKSIINEYAFIWLINQIDQQIKKIEKKLTLEEKEKIKLYNSQNNNKTI